jgi:hypothetical protein
MRSLPVSHARIGPAAPPPQVAHVESAAEQYRTHASFEQLMGRAPTLSDAEAKAALRAHVAALEEEELDASRRSVTDLMADATFAAIAAVNVGANMGEVKRVRALIGKEFFSLDSSRQAFVLLLLSDILVGYHSAEGWATMLELVRARPVCCCAALHPRHTRAACAAAFNIGRRY